MSPALSVADVERREFWEELCPGMSIEGTSLAGPAEVGDVKQLFSILKREGYIQVPGAFQKDRVAPIRAAVATLFERGIPLPFAFVYDELWQAFQSVSPFLSAVLGADYRALPDFWVWHVSPSEASAGWGPHRDRVQSTLDPDNAPHTLTVWLPFTDATPLNGCMYVLPAHLDDRFVERRWDGEGNNVVYNPQNIRALPATAGSLLAWNQSILHWGGRGSSLASTPRISAAYEFQRADQPAFNTPLLDPARIPTFTERLGLVGKQALQYRHMYPLSDEFATVAEALFERYMPGTTDFQPNGIEDLAAEVQPLTW